MRICGGAQLWSYSHLVDITRIPLIFHVNSISQKFILCGVKHGIYLCIPSFDCYNLETQMIIHAHPPSLEIAHLPSFKILLLNPILTLKVVYETSTTNIE